MKVILGFVVAAVVAVGGGWVWGASGKSEMDRALRAAELQNDLLEARAAVLEARVDIYEVNFGNASRRFEVARSALRSADARLNALDLTEDAKRVTFALTRIDEAQRMAGQLNQDANALAAEAAKAIDDVLRNTAAR